MFSSAIGFPLQSLLPFHFKSLLISSFMDISIIFVKMVSCGPSVRTAFGKTGSPQWRTRGSWQKSCGCEKEQIVADVCSCSNMLLWNRRPLKLTAASTVARDTRLCILWKQEVSGGLLWLPQSSLESKWGEMGSGEWGFHLLFFGDRHRLPPDKRQKNFFLRSPDHLFGVLFLLEQSLHWIIYLTRTVFVFSQSKDHVMEKRGMWKAL